MQNLKAGRNVRIAGARQTTRRGFCARAADNLPPDMAAAAEVMRQAESVQFCSRRIPGSIIKLGKGDLLIVDGSIVRFSETGELAHEVRRLERSTDLCEWAICSQGYSIEAGGLVLVYDQKRNSAGRPS